MESADSKPVIANSIRTIFRVSLFVKGLDGLLEFVGGMALLFSSSDTIVRFIDRITAEELTEDPHDLVANYILRLADQAGAVHFFGGIFFLSHGIVKLILVGFLLKENLKFYPWAIGTLSIFTVYQAYLAWQSPTIALWLLTLLDAVIVGLALYEFTHLRARQMNKTNTF